MISKTYGQLLFNAVRETLETMAFAEVVPCSFQIGDEEFTTIDETNASESQGDKSWVGKPTYQEPIQTDFSEKDGSDQSWGSAGNESEQANAGDSWGTPAASTEDSADSSWGTPTEGATDGWGAAVADQSAEEDPWGDSGTGGPKASGMIMGTNEINFNSLIENQDDWCWSCMRVNSPDIHSVWFVVSKSLAMELANNMYAGEVLELNSPLIRDLVAELTNVLGGRLMLLLEEMGGQFTLAVPEIGTGLPQMPDSATMETILCKVLVDGEYPVMSSICFNKK